MLSSGFSIKVLAVTLLCALVSACGSTPNTAKQPTRTKPIDKPDVLQPVLLDAETVIAALENAPFDSGSMFGFAETFIAENQLQAARAVLYALAPHINESQQLYLQSLLALTLPAQETLLSDELLVTPFSHPSWSNGG